MQRIKEIETTNKNDLSGKFQHGFKIKHGTLMAGLQIHSLITRVADGESYGLMI